MQSEQRIIGQTRDAGFQIGVRRSLPVAVADVWRLLTTPQGVQVWLGDCHDVHLEQGAAYRLPDGSSGIITVFVPLSHLRLTWQPPQWLRPSTIQLRVIASGEQTVVAFHQEHLPGPAERVVRRLYYLGVLDTLKRMIQNHAEPS